MGGFEGSIHPKFKSTGPSLQIVYPLTFFMVNDGNKLDPILRQSYIVYNTTKMKKGMIFYK
jgi:hypothetical protein